MVRRFIRVVMLCALLALGTGLLALRPAMQAAETSRYFPETQHYIKGLFLQYWNEHGGLAQQGYPLTEEFQEQSTLDQKTYTVQYFERAVFERHPENAATPYEVLLTQLGTYELQARYPNGAPPSAPNATNPRVFAETHHTIGGLFRVYWEGQGGLAQQGYPLTDEFSEANKLNGQTYTVQYFERAIFERHPENAGTPYEVLLTQLGKYQLDSRYPNNSQPAAAPQPTPPTGQPTTPPAPTAAVRATPTHVGTNCAAVADSRKSAIAHTGPVEISYVEATGKEYVEVHNTSAAAVDMSGWTLRDKNETDQHYVFPAGTSLVGGALIQVFTEPGHPYSFNRLDPIWNNCGDALELLKRGGPVVATYAYGTHCTGNNCP